MTPTTSELITAIADALRTNIAPLVADQPWPASELRTIDALLAHLAARVDHEADALRTDDEDLDSLLAELDAAGVPVSLELPPGASPAVGNLARRTALEAAIHLVHDGAHDGQVDSVRRYLVRAAERDRLVYRSLAERPLF